MSLISTMLESYCTGKRPTIGRDASQGVTQSPFVVLFRNVPCSCQQSSAMVKELYAQRNAVAPTTVHFAQNPGVEVNDVLDITTREGTTVTYLVEGPAEPTGRARIWSVGATLIREPS